MSTVINSFEFRQETDDIPYTRQVLFGGIIEELLSQNSDRISFTVELNADDFDDTVDFDYVISEVISLATPNMVDVSYSQPCDDDTAISCRSIRPKPVEISCYKDNNDNLYTLLCYVTRVYTGLSEDKTKLTISIDLIKAT